ncbi:isochorismate synthase [Gracilimonas tropica]|uniref:isochorismate synthase n=1 Tax=Gracilimonas tropica TaxID=454600 RepID=UPI00037F5DA4|nr:isochorismate synthase [Gracilimonas tropica]
MDSKNPVFNKVRTCFQDQISKLALREAINFVAQEDNPFRYLSFSIKIPSVDALAVLEQYAGTKPFQYYWEKPSAEFSIAAGGSLKRIQTTGKERFRQASDEGKQLLSSVYHITNLKHSHASVHLLGGFSFFDHNIGKEWRQFGAGSFNLPEWILVKNKDLTVLTITKQIDTNASAESSVDDFISTLDRLDAICDAGSYNLDRDASFPTKVEAPGIDSPEYWQWTNSVENATDLIKQGAFKKIVLARELNVKLQYPVSGTRLLNYLRNQYPDCYSFLISQDGETAFVGSTPERLASFHEREVLTEGLAGSISRGKTASEDAVLEHELLHSKKDLSEHAFVLDAIEENLQRYSDVYEHPKVPGIKKLSNVQHLYTPVHARIKEGVSRTEVLSRLHPTPAVGGYPREAAMPYINKLEYFDRGWYAGPIGWINAFGHGEFVVAIRSGLIKNNEVRFFAGCGIVEDSNPKKEWDETNLKFIPMLTALEHARK